MKLFRRLGECYPVLCHMRNHSSCCYPSSKPRHLICFKQWTAEMVMGIINSAINLKCCFRDTHCKRMVRLISCAHLSMGSVESIQRCQCAILKQFIFLAANISLLNVLENAKIMILQEINEPVLNMAVSKAATFLGAYDVNITDQVVWDQPYAGRFFSYMSDAIFVATSKHMCVQRFADQSSVPVLCMKSRTHASIQALATVMAIIEEFGSMKCVNLGWIGPPHPVLNSYLLLCPMLGANIKFKCCCDKCPVNPLLLKASEDMCSTSHTSTTRCSKKEEVLEQSFVVIAGPTTTKKDKIDVFKLSLDDIQYAMQSHWIFFHTCPRGEEVPDEVFYHCNARTFKVFENMQFIAAALMANAIKGFSF